MHGRPASPARHNYRFTIGEQECAEHQPARPELVQLGRQVSDRVRCRSTRPSSSHRGLVIGEEKGTRVDDSASCFCLATGTCEATSAASGSGGERQSRRKFPLGDEPEARDGAPGYSDRWCARA